jgi:hypothetical protein
MAGWRWLHSSDQPATWPFVLRVLGKAALLFVVFNLLFAWWQPLLLLGQVSLYNGPVTGRQRLPYGENPDRAYNLSLNNLEAMFASHAIAQPKAEDEFRVFLIGDSATWGILLEPAETLAGMLNAADLTAEDDRRVQVYNLGYPIMSLTKDLLLLDQAMQYDPDLIVWLFTLESFPRQKQLFPPLVQHNPAATRDLIAAYDLDLDPQDERFVDLDFWDQTIVGQRRELADWLRLQLYGIPWQATGIDQDYPAAYTPHQEDFDVDYSFQEWAEPVILTADDLAFEVLQAGVNRAGDVPILLVNEPMFVSSGENSDIRYNFFYPRWAYDSYREQLTTLAQTEDWDLLDLWDAIDMAQFTDSAVHYTPAGAAQLRDRLLPVLAKYLAP